MNDLKHFGILGMKWGVRKGKTSGGRTSKKSEDFLKTKALRKKKLDQLSNSELRSLNERLQLERQYKTLTEKKSSFGKKKVYEALGKIGTNLVNSAVKGFAERMAQDFTSRWSNNGWQNTTVINSKFLSD